MVKIEDDCVCCGLPCLGSSCPNKNVRHYYCDECGDETELYDFDGKELCLYCIKDKLHTIQ